MTSEASILEQIDTAVIGETDGRLMLSTREENRLASQHMAAQARNTICIASRDLDAAIYDTQEFCDGVRHLATSNRAARIQIMVWDTSRIINDGHRLVELMRRLTSFIDIKTPARQHTDYNEALLVVDETAYIHRELADRFEADANFNARREATHYAKQFKEMWDYGLHDPNLRRLHI